MQMHEALAAVQSDRTLYARPTTWCGYKIAVVWDELLGWVMVPESIPYRLGKDDPFVSWETIKPKDLLTAVAEKTKTKEVDP